MDWPCLLFRSKVLTSPHVPPLWIFSHHSYLLSLIWFLSVSLSVCHRCFVCWQHVYFFSVCICHEYARLSSVFFLNAFFLKFSLRLVFSKSFYFSVIFKGREVGPPQFFTVLLFAAYIMLQNILAIHFFKLDLNHLAPNSGMVLKKTWHVLSVPKIRPYWSCKICSNIKFN